MQVRMVGIDHGVANIENREKFSFTADEVKDALKRVKEIEEISGCIIISTCNRTELWISQKEEETTDIKQVLCDIAGNSIKESKAFLVERNGKEAIEHIMLTACGINSRVFGEDQILTQIRDALEISRDLETNSTTLEKVFLNAITAGKKVKDSVKLTKHSPSVASNSIEELKGIYGSLKNKNCLIIGNGKMAVLIAEHLVKNHAKVTMTMRKRYHHSEEISSVVPKGCEMISYDDRYQYVKNADIVISATLSPHYTLTLEKLKDYEVKEPSVWLDLAMPRDIDKKIEDEYKVSIYDIDSFETEKIDEEISKNLEFAKEIIGGYRDEILKWLEFRKIVPTINRIVKLAKKDTVLRAEKELKNLEIDDKTIKSINRVIAGATGRAVSKILFGLKDTLQDDMWDTAIESLLESAQKETIKK